MFTSYLSSFYFIPLFVRCAVYPSLEIVPLVTPPLPSEYVGQDAPTYYLQAGENLQWDCSVLAGEGDRLVWLLNGTVIESSSGIESQQVRKIKSISAYQ